MVFAANKKRRFQTEDSVVVGFFFWGQVEEGSFCDRKRSKYSDGGLKVNSFDGEKLNGSCRVVEKKNAVGVFGMENE